MRASALFLAVCLAASWALVSSAQDGEPSPCEAACVEQKVACVTECGDQDNPMQCEEQCETVFLDCTEQCPDD